MVSGPRLGLLGCGLLSLIAAGCGGPAHTPGDVGASGGAGVGAAAVTATGCAATASMLTASGTGLPDTDYLITVEFDQGGRTVGTHGEFRTDGAGHLTVSMPTRAPAASGALTCRFTAVQQDGNRLLPTTTTTTTTP